MKKTCLILTALLLSAPPAGAQMLTAPVDSSVAVPEQPQVATDPVMEQVAYLQTEWARIKYQVADEETKLKDIQALEVRAEGITATYADRPEPKIWEGIILSTEAGIVKGLSALPKVKKAKKLFEESLAQDSRALDGSAYTSLGSLYYQVPGWPIGFGDDEKAEKSLKTALQINPDGIDPNFFYGDFLLHEKRYGEAKTYLEHALQAADRPGRELADAGRRQETKAALAKVSEKLNSNGGSGLN